MPNEIVQTKFQKKLAVLSKVSFWTWIATLLIFVASVIFTSNPSNLNAMPAWVYLGNIGLGVIAFIVMILSYFVSVPRPIEETKSIYNTLGIGIGGLALLVILGIISPDTGSVSGARLYNSPSPDITISTNKTPTKTPTPSTTPSQQYKPKSTQIDCIGPDNKTFKATAEECAKFRTDWGLPAIAITWPTTNNRQTVQNDHNSDTGKITCATPGGTYQLTSSDCYALQSFYRSMQTDSELLDAEIRNSLSKITNTTYSPMPTLAPITVSPFPTIQPEPSPQNCYWKVNDYGAQFYYCQ